MKNRCGAGPSRRNEVQRPDEHASGHALIPERRWDAALFRERTSSGWRAWHRISVVLWVLASLSAILGLLGAITTPPLYALWPLVSVWLGVQYANRAAAIVRLRPDPPDGLWPFRTSKAAGSKRSWAQLRQTGQIELEKMRRYDEQMALRKATPTGSEVARDDTGDSIHT
jgi:hypothetical protein